MATRASDFLAQNPNYIGRANTSKRTAPKKEDEEKSKKGSGNQSWLSSIISELGGAGGAMGGAAAGAGIGAGFGGVGALPGAVIGGLVGGFGGGFGGRLVENQVRDNEFRVGDAAKEGLVSGAFGAAGAGFQGLRGAQALGKAGGGGVRAGVKGLGSLSDDAAKAVVLGGKKAGTAIGGGLVDDLGRLQYTGVGMQKGATGLGAGAKAKGMERLGAQQGDDFLQFMKNNKIPISAPEKALRPMEKLNTAVGKQLSNTYGKGITISDDILTKGATGVDDAVRASSGIDDLSGAGKKLFDKQARLFKEATDTNKMWKFKKDLGSQINFGASADSKTVNKELIARFWRQQADDVLNQVVPEVAEKNARYSTGKTLETLLKEASKPADRNGIWSRIMTSEAARGTEAKIGQGIQGAGNFLSSAPVRTGSQLARGTATRGLANSMMAEPQDPNTMQDPMMQEQGYQDVDGGVLTPDALYGSQAAMGGQQGLGGAIQGFDQPQMPQDNSPYAPQNLQNSVQQIMQQGGDLKDIKDFLSIAEVMNELQGGGASETNLTDGAVARISDTDKALIGIEEIGAMLGGEDFAGGPIPGNIRQFNPFDATFKSQQATIDRVRQIVGKALEGGVLRKEDEEKYKKILPTMQDPIETVKSKLVQLDNMIRADRENYIYLQQQIGGGGSGLGNFISQEQQFAPY